MLRSYINLASVIGLSVGGPIGGLVGGSVGWRWYEKPPQKFKNARNRYADLHRSFIGQVPIAVCCCLLITLGLRQYSHSHESEEAGSLLHQIHELKTKKLSFDYPGAVSLAATISLLLSLIDLKDRYSWDDPTIIGLSVGSVVSLALFFYLETYAGKRELLIPTQLLRTEVGAFCAGQILVAGSSHGVRSTCI